MMHSDTGGKLGDKILIPPFPGSSPGAPASKLSLLATT
jgi:hypothetical protein